MYVYVCVCKVNTVNPFSDDAGCDDTKRKAAGNLILQTNDVCDTNVALSQAKAVVYINYFLNAMIN